MVLSYPQNHVKSSHVWSDTGAMIYTGSTRHIRFLSDKYNILRPKCKIANKMVFNHKFWDFVYYLTYRSCNQVEDWPIENSLRNLEAELKDIHKLVMWRFQGKDKTYASNAKVGAAIRVDRAWLKEGLAGGCGHSNSGERHDEDNSRFKELHSWGQEEGLQMNYVVVKSLWTGNLKSNSDALYTFLRDNGGRPAHAGSCKNASWPRHCARDQFRYPISTWSES